MVGISVSAVGVSMGFEPITMLIRERGLTFDVKENLALIYDAEDDMVEVFKVKSELMNRYNVSLFKRAKNMKNFFEKVKAVAREIGYADDMKEYKANPDAYRGSIADVSMFLRVAVTGKLNAPDLYTVMQILGKDETTQRINNMIATL